MKHNKILLALLMCSFVSFLNASDSEDMTHFDSSDNSAAAVTPHEQKTANRIAKEHDAHHKGKMGHQKQHGKEARKSSAHAEKGKSKRAKKTHKKEEKHTKYTKKD